MIFCIMTHNAVCSRNICLLWSLVVMDCVTWHNLWSWNTDVYHTFSLTVYHTSFYVICFCQSVWQCVTLSVRLCLFLRVTVAYLLKLQGKLQFAFTQGRHALKNNFRGKKRLVIKAHLNPSVARLLIFNRRSHWRATCIAWCRTLPETNMNKTMCLLQPCLNFKLVHVIEAYVRKSLWSSIPYGCGFPLHNRCDQVVYTLCCQTWLRRWVYQQEHA